MRLGLLAALLVAALVLAAPALASAPDEATEAMPAEALAIQALSLLEQGGDHEEAMERLELAVEAEDQHGVRPEVLAAALEALEEDEPARAEELLKTAFTEEDIHLVGVTFRPSIETARVAAGIAGGVLAALALLGLLQRRRVDRSLGGV